MVESIADRVVMEKMNIDNMQDVTPVIAILSVRWLEEKSGGVLRQTEKAFCICWLGEGFWHGTIGCSVVGNAQVRCWTVARKGYAGYVQECKKLS